MSSMTSVSPSPSKSPPSKITMPARIVMRSATNLTLNDRFSKIVRPPEPPPQKPNNANGHHPLCPCLKKLARIPNSLLSQYSIDKILEDRTTRQKLLERIGRRSLLREQGQRIKSLLGDRIRSIQDTPKTRVIVSRGRSRMPQYYRNGFYAGYKGPNNYRRDPASDNVWPDRYGQWDCDNMPPRPKWNNNFVPPRYRVVNGRRKRNRTKYSLDRELSVYMSRKKQKQVYETIREEESEME